MHSTTSRTLFELVSQLTKQGTKGVSLDLTLARKLEHVPLADSILDFSRPSSIQSPRERFTWTCLDTILKVHHAYTAQDMIGVRDLANLERLTEFAVSLAVAPNLPGGVCLSFRKRVSREVKQATEDQSELIRDPNTLFGITLLVLCDVLLTPSEHPVDLSRIILTKHLHDVLGGLVTIIACPGFLISHEPKPGFTWSQYALNYFRRISQSVDARQLVEAMCLILQPDSARWTQQVIGKTLSRIACHTDDGLKIVLAVTVGGKGNIPTESVQKAANIVLTIPATAPSPSAYLHRICPQLLSLLLSDDTALAKTSAYIMGRFVAQRRHGYKTYIIRPLLASLMEFCSSSPCQVSEAEILECLKGVERFIQHNDPSPAIMNKLNMFLIPLIHMHQSIASSATYLKPRIRSLIDAFLRLMDVSVTVGTLGTILLEETYSKHDKKIPSFNPGPTGAVCMSLVDPPPDRDILFLTSDPLPETVCGLIIGRRDESTTHEIREPSTAGSQDVLAQGLFKLLLRRYADASQNSQVSGFALVRLTRTLAILVDKLGSNLVGSEADVIPTLSTLLNRDDDEDVKLVCLQLLLGMVQDGKLAKHELDSVGVVELAQNTRKYSQNSDLRRLAGDFLLWVSASNTLETASLKPKSCEALDEDIQLFTRALHNLRDPMIPVRAFGVSMLKKLVLKKSPITVDNVSSIMDLLLALIREQDSFVYLNTVQAYAALADVYPNECIEQVVRFFELEEELDSKLRLGEVLCSVADRLGPMVAKYAKVMVPVVLEAIARALRSASLEGDPGKGAVVVQDQAEADRAVKNEDLYPGDCQGNPDKNESNCSKDVIPTPSSAIMSSCFGVLSSVGASSPLALLPFADSILDLLHYLLISTCTTVVVRRGAVTFVSYLMDALTPSSLVGVQDYLRKLKDVLRLLEADGDDVVRVKARLGLESLEAVLLEALTESIQS